MYPLCFFLVILQCFKKVFVPIDLQLILSMYPCSLDCFF